MQLLIRENLFLYQNSCVFLLMAQLQVEGAIDLQIDPDTIRVWMKTNHPTLSEAAITKLQKQGFVTMYIFSTEINNFCM